MLKTRVLSAAVMAPPALLAAWFGGYAFAVMIAAAAAVMCWEWQRMLAGRFDWSGRAAALFCLVAALLAVSHPEAALVAVAVGAVASLLLAGGTARARMVLGAGALYAGLPSVAIVWLRAAPDNGRDVVLWMLALVWATDVGAYAFGRLIGGPLLLPMVSPKKTWAGLLGGMLCASLAGLALAVVLGHAHPAALAAISGGLAVVAQIGDLFESWVKRRCGVKDSSNIIPGHGGVLDRVDGLLTVALAVAALDLVLGIG